MSTDYSQWAVVVGWMVVVVLVAVGDTVVTVVVVLGVVVVVVVGVARESIGKANSITKIHVHKHWCLGIIHNYFLSLSYSFKLETDMYG